MTPIYGNDKIAEAARRFVTVRTAYQDACTMTADDPIDGEAMEAFGAGLVEAERRLIEVCSEPGREPFPEAICPPWLDPDGPCLRQGQVLTPSGPLYLSSDGPTLVALPQATECKAGLKVLRNMMALLNVCGSRWHQIDHGALMSWLMEVVMEVARRESTRPARRIAPFRLPAGKGFFDAVRLLRVLRELEPVTSKGTIAVREVPFKGACPALKVVAPGWPPLWQVVLMGLAPQSVASPWMFEMPTEGA